MKLTRDDWTTAAGTLMAEKGAAAVKVEVLARTLNVSKGSFYWHFKNRAALLEAMMQRWEADTDRLIAESQKAPTPQERWSRLFMLISHEGGTGANIDAAIFLWSKQDKDVLARVKLVEQKRLDYLSSLIEASGFPQPEATHRAEIAYFSFVGYVERASRHVELQNPENLRAFGAYLIELLFTKKD